MLVKLIASALQKAQICLFLGLPQKTKEPKASLIAQLLQRIEIHTHEYMRLLDTFVTELAVGPSELETLLHCSKVERVRWVKEQKIPILAYRSFRKGGKELQYPLHDRRIVHALSQEQIASWREEHQMRVQEHRKVGAHVAAEQRKMNQQTRQDFCVSWLQTVEVWKLQGSIELAAVLQLGYWTGWASRWAKENHLKALRGTKHFAMYATRRDAWYERKNEAMQVLAQTPYARLTFYRPGEPDKWSLRLCEQHYDEKKEGFYEDIWEFYALHKAMVKHCPHCLVHVEKDYYSLYFLEITSSEFPDMRFSFHMPYPIGKNIFPGPRKLVKIEHIEQDGLFRFGRALPAYERVTHREKDVLVYFERALTEAKRLYFVDKVRRSSSVEEERERYELSYAAC